MIFLAICKWQLGTHFICIAFQRNQSLACKDEKVRSSSSSRAAAAAVEEAIQPGLPWTASLFFSYNELCLLQ
jgi:hypothetical protein